MECAWAALLGSGSILALPCPLLGEVLAGPYDRMVELRFSKGFTVRKEKCVLPLCETCFHTPVGSKLRQKRQKCCF